MRRLGPFLCLGLLTASAPAGTPVADAHADLAALPAGVRSYYRYLDFSNRLALDREAAFRVLSGHVNGLSRETDITVPYLVPGTAGGLVRVNVFDYGWDVATWEKLADVDPYFQVTATVNGKRVKALRADTAADATRAKELIEWTQSRAPILRGDWFFNQTAIQADRVAGYYDWLGVKDEVGFQRLVGIDFAKKRRKFELREAVAKSGVTDQPRAYARFDADEGGAYRYTLDFRKAVLDLNPLKRLDRDIERAYLDPKNVKDVASEQFGDLPNGMLASGLFNNKGERQDSAPDFIASDGRSKSNDRRVHVNMSCLRCHTDAGTQSLRPWFRNLFQPPLALQDPDYRRFRALKQQYLRDMETAQKRDRERFAAAVKEATGLTAKEYQAAYAAEWERYEDAEVDAEWAARDLGVTVARLKAGLRWQLQATGGIDEVAGVFLLEGDRKQAITIRQWEEVYEVMQVYLRGIQ